LTATQDVYVAVALDSTASSVTSITDTKGNSYTLDKAQNGTGVRTEIWKSHSVGVQLTNIITINVSPNCNIAGAAEEYAGVSASGNTGSTTGSTIYPDANVTTQEGGNFVAGAIGFACVSGDTLTAQLGTSERSSIPAATAVGVALYDNTMTVNGIVRVQTKISTARQWAVAIVELRGTGLVAVTAVDYATTAAAALAVSRDTRFLLTNMPSGGGGGILPPSGDGQFFPRAF
jgi:hypothetical protein